MELMLYLDKAKKTVHVQKVWTFIKGKTLHIFLILDQIVQPIWKFKANWINVTGLGYGERLLVRWPGSSVAQR